MLMNSEIRVFYGIYKSIIFRQPTPDILWRILIRDKTNIQNIGIIVRNDRTIICLLFLQITSNYLEIVVLCFLHSKIINYAIRP